MADVTLQYGLEMVNSFTTSQNFVHNALLLPLFLLVAYKQMNPENIIKQRSRGEKQGEGISTEGFKLFKNLDKGSACEGLKFLTLAEQNLHRNYLRVTLQTLLGFYDP